MPSMSPISHYFSMNHVWLQKMKLFQFPYGAKRSWCPCFAQRSFLSFKMLLVTQPALILCVSCISSSDNHTQLHCVWLWGDVGGVFNSDSLPILWSLSSGHPQPPTGKMVKKVCPCNQLCSNYLSFWSFLPPSIPFLLALALRRIKFDHWPDLGSVQLSSVFFFYFAITLDDPFWL